MFLNNLDIITVFSFILYMILRKKALVEMLTRPHTEFWYYDPLDYVLEKTLESPLDSKIKPVHPNIHWKDWCWNSTSDLKSQLIAKDPDTGKDWRQKKRVVKDEMVR